MPGSAVEISDPTMVLTAGAIVEWQRELTEQNERPQNCFTKMLRCATRLLWMLPMFRRGIGGGFCGCLDVVL